MTDDLDEEATADREAVRAAVMSSRFRKRSPRKKKDGDKPDDGGGADEASK